MTQKEVDDAPLMRKIPYNSQKNITPENWKPDYTRILLMTQRGAEPAEIAKELRLSTSLVYKVRNSTFFVQKLAGLQTKVIERVTEKRSEMLATDKARAILTKASLFAAKKVIKLAKEGLGKDRLQFDACKDIMDRAGLKPIEILETRERVYSPEEVAHAKAILVETQEIVERFSNKRSPYIIRDSVSKKLPSSDTDKAHDAQPKIQTDAKPS